MVAIMSGSNVPKAAELAAGFGTDALRWAAALHSCSCIIRFLPATSCASQIFPATGALRNSRQGESAPSRNERRCQRGFPRSRYGCGTLYIQASPVPTFFVLHDICCQLSHGRPCLGVELTRNFVSRCLIIAEGLGNQRSMSSC